MRHALMFMLALLLAGPAVFAQDDDFDFDDMEEVDRGGEGDDGGLDDRGLDDGGLDELLDGRGEEATTDSGDKRDILRSWKGFLETEIRVYLRDRGQGRNDEQLLLRAEFELDFRFSDQITGLFRPRLLVDALDGSLKRFEPLEAYVTWSATSWDVRVGQFIENWGIVDTFNPIDVINRRDFATDFLDPERLGEFGVRVRAFGDGGETLGEPTLSFYWMPVFRAAEFAPEGARFSFGTPAMPFDEDGGFEPSGEERVFYALRFQATLATRAVNADIQALVARGPEHVPTFAVGPTGTTPVYYGAWTWGVGARAVPNADVLGEELAKFTFKLEVALKDPYAFGGSSLPAPDDYVSYVVGVDRTFDRLFTTRDQITCTLEYAREVGASDPASQFRLFRNDIIGRVLWEANDFARTSVELRILIDLDVDEQILEIVFDRQMRGIDDDIKLSIQVQVFDSPGDGSTLFDAFPNNTSLSISLRWNF